MPNPVDPGLNWLIAQMAESGPGPALWCLDEQAPADFAPPPGAAPVVLSNRWDQAERARELGLEAHFSDLDFSAWPDGTFARLYYRLSKEKPIAHRVINAARRLLQPDGELLLCGRKNEGAKSAIDRAGRTLGRPQKARKEGELYTACLLRGETPGEALDDSDYDWPRPIAEQAGLIFYSKPGLFGWHQRDRGSQLLWECVEPLLRQRTPKSLLDLGCGYGYLGLLTGGLPLDRRVLTDNNAAAVAMARYNAEHNGIDAEVVADDCARGIAERFDTIVCNPPFHQGFAVSGDLTDRFLDSARRHLAPGGRAFFVVNRFVPLARKAQGRFSRVSELADREGFRVFELG